MIHNIFRKKKKTNLSRNNQLEIRQTSSLLGVELEGIVDITSLKSSHISQIKTIVNEHHLLVIRGNRRWTLEEQKAFTSRVGDFEGDEFIKTPSNKNLYSCAKSEGVSQSGMYWHSDNAHQKNPSHLSVLQMVEIPKVGSQIFFASLLACYNDLTNNFKNEWKKYEGIYGNDILHPLIWKHPFNGKQVIYLDIGSVSEMVVKHKNQKLSIEETNAIICELNKIMNCQLVNYTHNWHVGDLILVDNYAIAHRSNVLFENHKRTLLCTTTKGVYF